MRNVRVGELKKLLADVADDVIVLTDASDHSYAPVSANVTTAIQAPRFSFSEDCGQPLEEDEIRVPCVVIE